MERIKSGIPGLDEMLNGGFLPYSANLVEGAPGLAKTRAINVLSKCIHGDFHRVQFTPDLLPSDVTGTSIFNQQTRQFEFRPGPLMGQIILADEIDKGKCPKVEPGWGNDSLCTPSGGFDIPESLLSKGTYTLTLKTSSFQNTSDLIVGTDSISLNIPSNNNFSSTIHAIYPMPPNLLFGNIVYSGVENTTDATTFLNDLLTLGLVKTRVPNYPYLDLQVDKDGNAIDSSWPPDNYSLGILYNMNNNFKDIFNLTKDYFSMSNINIYLFSSNGDQARFDKIDGIVVVYAK